MGMFPCCNSKCRARQQMHSARRRSHESDLLDLSISPPWNTGDTQHTHVQDENREQKNRSQAAEWASTRAHAGTLAKGRSIQNLPESSVVRITRRQHYATCGCIALRVNSARPSPFSLLYADCAILCLAALDCVCFVHTWPTDWG